jgi:hypothetical protein
MRTPIRIGFGAAVLTAVFGCGGGDRAADGKSALEQLQLSEADAERFTADKLVRNDFAYYAVSRAFKALDGDARASVVKGAASWAKVYLGSDAFAASYAKMRADAKPTLTEYTESVDEELERTLEKQRAEFEESRKSFASLPEDTRKSLEESFEATMKMMDEPQMRDIQRQGIEQRRVQEKESYETALVDWEKNYPEDVKELITLRLRDFLVTTEGMDFDAELEERDGRQFFEDPDLEAKSGEWKVYFRAGEEAVTAAREAATEWLDDID